MVAALSRIATDALLAASWECAMPSLQAHSTNSHGAEAATQYSTFATLPLMKVHTYFKS